ncbi:MAG: alpha/beta hydrolase [Kofleriaceae bacterium]|nr:alpha/beta hydrolase [Kofleriaceae bacterium]
MRLAVMSCIAAALVLPSIATAAPPRVTQPSASRSGAAQKAKPRWQTLPLPPAMPSPRDKGFVEVDGAQIYYARFGAAGEPVILLHGGMGNADHWSHQVKALADKLQVIAIDSRGQGRSTRTKAKPSYDQMAEDVIAVMDKLELKKASLVGWSDGGEIALKLAIQHPDRVAKLFILGSNYDAKGSKPRRGPLPATFAAYAAKCRADYRKMSRTPKQYDDVQAWLVPIWRNPMGFTKDQLRAIAAPTIVADGDHDEIIELAQVEEMAKLIPNARLEVFADTSHFALWQDPEAVNNVLLDFLAPAAPAK